jgi:Domain of unknown function (DUF4372)
LGNDPDTILGVNAMRHHNSVFHQLLKHLPRDDFERLAAVHRADARARRLTSKSQLVAMLYGQLAGAASLREIAGSRATRRGCTIWARSCRGARPWRTPTTIDRAHCSASCWR